MYYQHFYIKNKEKDNKRCDVIKKIEIINKVKNKTKEICFIK